MEANEYLEKLSDKEDVEYEEDTLKAFALGLHAAGVTYQEMGYEQGDVHVNNFYNAIKDSLDYDQDEK